MLGALPPQKPCPSPGRQGGQLLLPPKHKDNPCHSVKVCPDAAHPAYCPLTPFPHRGKRCNRDINSHMTMLFVNCNNFLNKNEYVL